MDIDNEDSGSSPRQSQQQQQQQSQQQQQQQQSQQQQQQQSQQQQWSDVVEEYGSGRGSRSGIELASSDSTVAPVISTAYSPVGLVLHELARLPLGVEPLLRDRRGIFHYHRPAARFAGAHSHAMRQVVRRIALAGAAGRAHAEQGRRRQGRGCKAEAHAAAAAAASEDPDEAQWESDGSDGAGGTGTGIGIGPDAAARSVGGALLRVRARDEARRRRGVAKPAARRGALQRAAQQSLAAAYARYQTDEPAIRRTVSEMGHGDPETILQMIRGGISVDVADSAGRTPLHVAATCGNAAGLRLLLRMGAAVNARDCIGNTALTLAATAARADAVVMLLEAGADPRVGGGLVSATAMVRARLRLLRTGIRHARQAERDLGVEDAHAVRDRRIRSAEVARECVDIIRLLRHYSLIQDQQQQQHHQQQHPETHHPPDDALDDLVSQLASMGLDGRAGAAGAAAPRVESGASAEPASPKRPGSPPPADEEDRMDDLLDRFAQLLGDDDGGGGGPGPR